MSKILDATANALGVVSVDGLVLPGAVILSEGAAASEGLAVLDGENVWYLTKTSPDLKSTLDNLIDVLSQLKTGIDKIGDTFTDVGLGMAGSSTAPPPTLGASVTAIKATATAIDAIKTDLQTLTDGLK